ncbi:S8 family serine peptidase [Candidatus Woesearchaeota archaeon]|nr:S8 family serine peptidase [Candidatus Woesearchaeota archaeon]
MRSRGGAKAVLFFAIIILLAMFAEAGRVKEELERDIAGKPPTELVPVLIQFKEKPTPEQASKFASDVESKKGKFKRAYKYIKWASAELPVKEMRTIAARPDINIIQPDHITYANLDVSVPLIAVPQVIAKGVIGAGVKVAILDSGVTDRADLNVIQHIDLVNECVNNVCTGDFNGHGTHVAGIVASKQAGFTGVAPGAQIIDVKVLNKDNAGRVSTAIFGIQQAIDAGADIISMSLSAQVTPCDGTDAQSAAVDSAVSEGKIVVVSAGNAGPNPSTLGSPACSKLAITVGATDDADQIAFFSSRGPTADGRTKPDIVAPGVRITSLLNALQGNRIFSGTSQSAPHISGVAALLKSKNPALKQEDIRNALQTTAKDLGLDRNTQGAGRVNALAAFNKLNPCGDGACTPDESCSSCATDCGVCPTPDTTPPTCAITTPTTLLVTSSTLTLGGTTTDNVETTTLVCNGVTTTLAGTLASKTFSATLPLTEGDNTVTCTARDNSGNTGTCTQTFTRDTTLPVITCPTNQVVQSTPFAAAGLVSDSGGVSTVFVNGIPATLTPQGWSTSLAVAEGQNTFTAEAKDNADNSQRCSFTITLQPPVVTPPTQVSPPPLVDLTRLTAQQLVQILTRECQQLGQLQQFICPDTTVQVPPLQVSLCKDSDAGDDPSTKGTLVAKPAGTNTFVVLSDRCLSSTRLSENACEGDVPVGIGHDCPCADGKCTAPPATPPIMPPATLPITPPAAQPVSLEGASFPDMFSTLERLCVKATDLFGTSFTCQKNVVARPSGECFEEDFSDRTAFGRLLVPGEGLTPSEFTIEIRQDACTNEQNIEEHFCNPTPRGLRAFSQVKPCDAGCRAGACVIQLAQPSQIQALEQTLAQAQQVLQQRSQELQTAQQRLNQAQSELDVRRQQLTAAQQALAPPIPTALPAAVAPPTPLAVVCNLNTIGQCMAQPPGTKCTCTRTRRGRCRLASPLLDKSCAIPATQ